MMKKILLLASLFVTLISFSQRLEDSREPLQEGEGLMMGKRNAPSLGQRPSGFIHKDINKADPLKNDLTLRGNMTFIGNNNLNIDVKKTRDFRDQYKYISRYSYPYILNNGSVYTGNETANDSFNLDLYVFDYGNRRQELGNGSAYMDYVDVDGNVDEDGDGKDDTFSSSTATLGLPNCSKVAYAALYWAGVYPREFWITDTTPTRSEDYDKIKFKYPSSVTYENITADETIYNANEPYICFKDITAEVKANPNGVYTAANIRATREVDHYNGLGGASGWVMIVVYENDNESSKNFSIFDGFANIYGARVDGNGNIITPANEEEITFNGFKTIPSGPVKVELIMATLEGDKAIPGDNYQIKNNAGNYVNISNNLSPENNFFNSSISIFDSYLSGRNPASTNTLGFDVDHIKIDNTGKSIIANNQTSLDVKFTTKGDVYWPFLNAMSVEVVEPKIKLVKTITDDAGDPIPSAGVDLGDEIFYKLNFKNVGTDNAKNTVIIDELPKNVDFVGVMPATISLVATPPTYPNTNTDIVYTYEEPVNANSFRGKLRFYIPDNFVKINGAEHSIKLKVKVVDDCNKLRNVCSNKIKNQAYSNYSRDLSFIDPLSPNFPVGYINRIENTPSFAGVDPCNLGQIGTSNFLINTNGCTYERTEIICGGEILLTAGDGFESYSWENVNNPGVELASTQTYKATTPGVYIVKKVASIASGCIGSQEKITVESYDTAGNPLLPFVDQIVTSCTSNTEELAEIYLCGIGASKKINLSFTSSTEVRWFKLDETKPCDVTKPTELPLKDDCANIGTGCSWEEIGTKTGAELSKEFSEKGQYKLEVLYGKCPATYYFNVFISSLNPIFDKEHIICETDGSITVNNIPNTYEYKLTGQGYTAGFQDGNKFENLTKAGDYNLTIRLKGSTDNACSFDYVVNIQKQDLGLNLPPEIKANCTDDIVQITAQLNGDLIGTYNYTLYKNSAVMATKTATTDKSATFDVTESGQYTVKVTATGTTCSEEKIINVSKPNKLNLSALKTKDITCLNGSSAGIITLAGSGGTIDATAGEKYKYVLWVEKGVNLHTDIASIPSTAFFTDNTYSVANGDEGYYEFLVFDSNDCTAKASQTIDVEAPLTFTHKETEVNCKDKGTITVDVTNNTTGYTLEYSIDNSNWKPLNVFENLNATTPTTLYTIYIRATKPTHSCTYEISDIAITQIAGLTGGSAVATGLSCSNGNTQSNPVGKITFTPPTGGTTPYTYFYKLSTDTNFIPVTSGNTSVDVSQSGKYDTKVEDANNCPLNLSQVEIRALPTEPTLNSEVLICGSTGTVIITPKDASYEYSIDGVNFQASNVFENVPRGGKTFTVKYGSSCTKSIDVSVYGQPFLGNFVRKTDSDCSGSDNGTITIEASNFQGGSYEYSTDGGVNWKETGDNPYRIVGLEAKEHHLFIREVLGTAPNQVTCEVDLGKHTIGEPVELTLVSDPKVTTPATCTIGATITVEASGGTPPYKYSIDNGVTWQTSPIFTDVAPSATKYKVLLLDSRKCDECGCTDNPFENGSFEDHPRKSRTSSGYLITHEDNIPGWDTTEPKNNEIEIWYNNFQNVAPYEGKAFAELNANKVGSLYQEFCTKPGDKITWSVAHRGRSGVDVATVKIGGSLATAVVKETMTDNNTAWGEYSSSIPYIVPVGQTTTVIAFEAVSSTGGASYGNFIDGVKIEISRATCVLREVEVKAPSGVTHTAEIINNCSNAEIKVTAKTGDAPYQFSIDGGAWQTPTNVNDTEFTFNNTNGLIPPTTTAKDYTIKIKDGGGCESAVSTITINPKVKITTAKTPKNCKEDATITITASGGVGNYVYEITPSTGATITGNKITVKNTGSYTVKVKDNNGNTGFCTAEEVVEITEIKNPIVAITNATELDCKLNTTASISFEVSEGKAPFSYTVHNGTSTIKTESITGNADTITGLDAGTYKIIVTDDNGCTGEISQTIEALVGLTGGSAVGTDSHCGFDVDVLKAYDGTGPLGYGSSLRSGEINFTEPITGIKPYTYYYKKDGDTDYILVQGNSVSGLPLGTSSSTYKDTTYNTKVVDAKGCSIYLDDVTIKVPKPNVWDYEYTENCGDGTTVDVILKPYDPTYIYLVRGQPAQTGVDANKFYDYLGRYYSTYNGKLFSHNFTFEIYSADGCLLYSKGSDGGFEKYNLFQAKIIEPYPVPVCAGETTGSVKVEAFIKKNTGNELYPANFEYSLDDGANWAESVGNPYTITGLSIGDNTIKIRKKQLDLATGEKNCDIELKKEVIEIPVIEIEATATPTTCSVLKSTITPKVKNNYFRALDYELLDSSGNSFPTKKTISSYTGPNSFTNIPVGKYKIVATWLGNGPETGALGCKSAPIDIEIKAPKDIEFTTTQTACYSGNNDATITVNVTKGNDDYRFSINTGIAKNPDVTTPNSYTFTGLSAGKHKIVVTDGSGCDLEKEVTIKPQLKVSAITTQATCKAGTLTITASGGDTKYVYAVVSNGTAVTSADFNATKPTTITEGTWDIYVRDNEGNTGYCQEKTTKTVTKIPNPTIDKTTVTQPECSGETGKINVVVANGKTDYTVTVTGSGTTPTVQTKTGSSLNYEFTGLVADTYTIKVVDENTCASVEKTEKITAPSALKDGKAEGTDISCPKSSSQNVKGVITFTNPTGGTPDPVTGNYTFYYKLTTDTNYTIVIGNSVSGLSEGTYKTKVLDINGCEKELEDITIDYPKQPDFKYEYIANCDGTFNVTILPEDSSYTYILEEVNGSTYKIEQLGNNVFTNVSMNNPNMLYYRVKYGNNCVFVQGRRVLKNSVFNAEVSTFENPKCNNENTGSITVKTYYTTNQGTPNTINKFQYSTDGTTWKDATTNPFKIDGFSAGTHTIKIRPSATSPSTCDVSLTASELINPSKVEVTKAPHTQITCTSTTSTITPEASGGNGATYTFELLDSAKVSLGNTFTGLNAGTYYVVARDKENCESEPFEVIIADKKGVTFDITKTLCYSGNNDASIKVTNITGNDTNFTFSISDGVTTKTQTSAEFINLSAGTYTITVSDGFGCSKTVTPITINNKITADIALKNETCNKGSLTISNATGGSGTDYVYAVVSENTPVTSADFTATTVYNLSADKYDVYVRDNNGNTGYCEFKILKEIIKIADLTATIETVKQPKCDTDKGTIEFKVSGGKSDYTYTVNDGTSTTASANITGNTHTISGLSTGNYIIVVTDKNTCTFEIPTQKIEAPDKLEKDGDSTPIHFTCKTVKGGIDFVNPKGGTGVYTFSYKLDGTPVTAYTPLLAGIKTVSGLDAGTYNIKVKDVNNCEIALNDVTINPLPTAPTFDVPVITYNCEGKGSFTITPFDTSYTYSLDGATPQTGTNANIFADLDAGSYTVSVGYGSDCFTDIDVIVANDKKFGASVTKTVNPTCFGASDGSITIEAVNATFPYEYSTDNGTNWKSATTNIVTESGLADGIYNVKVKQNATAPICEVVVSTEKLTNPLKVEVTATVEQEITCSATGTEVGATIKVIGTKGISHYTYELFEGVVLKGTISAGVNTFTNIAVGNYTVVATDSKLCKSDAFPIEVKAKKDIKFNLTPEYCYDGSNGTIVVEITNGNGDYQIKTNTGTWQNLTPTSTTPLQYTLTGLSPSLHTITVRDKSNCEVSDTVTIYPELSATQTPTNISCKDGKIVITPKGGDGNYKYTITPSIGTTIVGNEITITQPETYMVTVQDKGGLANACSVTLSNIVITKVPEVKITSKATQPQCNGNKGSIDGEITANTGQAPFTITIANSGGIITTETITGFTGTKFSFNNLPDETYTIEITDALECKVSKKETLKAPPALVMNIEPILPKDCTDTDITHIGFDFNFGSLTLTDYAPYTLQYTLDGDNDTGWTDMSTLNTSLSASPHPTPGDNLYSVRNLVSGTKYTPAIRILNIDGTTVRCQLNNGIFVMPYTVNGLKVDITTTPAGCETGYSVTVEALGGVGPYEFAFVDPLNPILPPTIPLDLNTLTWYPAEDPSAINESGSDYRKKIFTNIIPGVNYQFFVKDNSNGCIETAKEDAALPTNTGFDVKINPSVLEQSCNGTNNGQLSFEIKDDVITDILSGKELKWQLYDGFTDTPISGKNGVIPNTTGYPFTLNSVSTPVPSLQNLPAGLYFIIIEDKAGTAPNICRWGSEDIEIKKGIPFKGNLKKVKDITCVSPGKVRIENVTGGFGDYTYTVTGIANSTQVTPITIPTGKSTFDVTYADVTNKSLDVEVTILVTDKNQCSFELPKVTLKVSENPTINSVTVNSCGAVNTIDINTTGGFGKYQYSLDGINFQAPVSTANHTITVDDGKNQTLTVKDANGCTDTFGFDVYKDITFFIAKNETPNCIAPLNREVSIKIQKGSGNYEYSLDGDLIRTPVIGTPAIINFTGLTSGNYTIEVFDLNTTPNCSKSLTFTVPKPIDPVFTASITKNNSCKGSDGGEITITPTINGAEPLTFTIAPVAGSFNSTTNVFEDLPVGEYEITAKGNNNGCEFTYPDKLKITEFDKIIVPTPTVAEFACNTGTNTRNQAIVKVPNIGTNLITGGSGTYTKAEFVFTPYLADGITAGIPEPVIDSNTFEFTTDNILGGTLAITVYDDKGCEGTATAIIKPFIPISNLEIKDTDVTKITCSANESIKVSFDGIATEIKVVQTEGAGYTQTPATPILISPVEFTNLPVGKYTITVKQATGCEDKTYHTVTEIPAYTILLSDKVPTTCVGSSTGSIKIDVKDYVGNYDYEIVDKSTGIGLTPAKTGTNVSGIESISNLPKGEYKVKILTGTINCTVTDKDFKIEDAPIALSVKAEETSAVQCIDDANATITVTETKGGWGDYEYQLEDASGIVSGYDFATNKDNKVFTNLKAGTYKVRVKDGNGCDDNVYSDEIIIANPTKVEFTVSKDDTVCDANIGGSIIVDLKDAVSGLAGGKPPYTYTLTDDASTPNVKTVTIINTEYTFTDLSKANYTVSVKDDNLCDGTVTGSTNTVEIYDDIVFTEPTLVTELKCQANGVDNTDAVYNINVSGGSGTFTYLVTEKDDTSKVITVTPATLTTPATFKTSVAEEYTITITDTGVTGTCSEIVRNFTVEESVKPYFEATATTTDICFGSSDGVITINEKSTPTINPIKYTISLKNGTLKTGEGKFENSPKRFGNLPAGFYTITGTGTNDCTFIHAEIEIKETPKVTIEANAISDIVYNCNTTNPKATITVDKIKLSGGNKNYNVEFVFTPNDGGADVTQASSNFEFSTTNTKGGKVKITVSDDQGCSSVSAIKEVIIPDFTPITNLEIKDSDITPISCSANESIKVTFDGIATEIKVVQTEGTGYTAITKTPVSPATEFTNLPVGKYTITVKQAIGCEFEIPHEVIEIPAYIIDISEIKHTTCVGSSTGSIKINIDNYTGNYDYEVVDSATGSSLTTPIKETGVSGVKEISNLSKGKYKVKIALIGSPNCSVNLSEEFEIIDAPKGKLEVTAKETLAVKCIDETNATITVTETKGGWGNYEYQLEIKDAVTNIYSIVKDASLVDINFANNKDNKVFENLKAGTYKVRVKDGNSCDDNVYSDEVIIKNPTKVEFTVSKDDTACDTSKGGEITVTGSGGTGTYIYTLTDDTTPTAIVREETGVTGAFKFTDLPAKNYTVTVKDTNQCNGTVKTLGNDTLKIYEDIDFPTPISSDKLTCNTSQVAFEIKVKSGGSGNFTYGIIKDEISGDIIEVPTGTPLSITNPPTFTTSKAGEYIVTIVDTGVTGNCSTAITRTLIVNEPAQPKFTAEPTTSNICNGSSDGVITITEVFIDEVDPVIYTIIPEPTGFVFENNSFKNLPAGTYTIKGTGNNACFETKSVKIEETDKVVLGTDAINDVTYNCDVATASVKVDKDKILGGSGSYNVEFVYDNGTPLDNTDDVTQPASSNFEFTTPNTKGGEVKIIVSDEKGCSSVEKTVTIPAFVPILKSNIKITNTPTCENNKQSITVTLENLDASIITPIKVEIKKPNGSVISREMPRTVNGIGTTFDNLPLGTYKVSIIHPITGCEVFENHVVKEPFYNVLLSDVKPVTCTDSATGSVVINVQIGDSFTPTFYTNAYDYEVFDALGSSLTPVKTGSVQAVTGTENPLTISGLEAGNYYVKITNVVDAPACSFTSKEFEIIEAPAGKLKVSAEIISEITCTDSQNAKIKATRTGGWGSTVYQLEYAVTKTGTYTIVTNYDFDKNNSNNLFENLKEGFYIVKAKDSQGCIAEITDVIEVVNPKPVTFETAMICDVNKKSAIKVTAKGGSGTYIYTLKDSAGTEKESITKTDTEHIFENLSVDNNENYTVSVNDVKGCIGTPETVGNDTVTVYPELQFYLTPAKLTCKTDGTTTKNAVYQINVTGGSGNLSYEVYKKEDVSKTVAVITTTSPPSFSIEEAGTYILKITDDNGGTTCNSKSKEFIVGEPVKPKFNPVKLVDNICFGSSNGVIYIESEIQNGINPLEYSISPNPNNVIFDTISKTFTGLSKGKYTITGKGTNDCITISKEIEIFEKSEITIDTNKITVTNFACTTGNTTNTASVKIDKDAIIGGIVGTTKPNFNRVVFVYDNGTVDTEDDITQDSESFDFYIFDKNDNTSGGKVAITIYDEQNCSSSSTTIIKTIKGFDALPNAVISITKPITCTSGEDILVTFDAPLGTSKTITIQGVNGNTYPLESQNGTGTKTVTFTNLPSGKYEIIVNNPDTGCTYPIGYTVKDAPTFNVKIGDNRKACFDVNEIATASVTLDIQTIIADALYTPYTGAYTYEVLDGTGNSLTPKIEGNGTGGTQNVISDLKVGSYKVKLVMTDSPECEVLSEEFIIKAPPTELILDNNSTVNYISCLSSGKGSVILKADGGWGNYEYKLEKKQNNITTVIQDFGKNDKIEGLEAGSYTATVKDINNCEATYEFTLKPTTQLEATVNIGENLCEGEQKASITITNVTGGQTQDTNVTYSYTLKYPNGLEVTQTSNIFNNLLAGNYEVRVVDNKYSCVSKYYPVTIIDPIKVEVSANITADITCDIPTATVEISGAGGEKPYTFSNDGVSFSSVNKFTNVSAGDKTFYVKDAKECVVKTIVKVEDYIPLKATLKVDSGFITCKNDSNGVLSADVIGGFGNYEYQLLDENDVEQATWQQSNTFGSLNIGTYKIKVRSTNRFNVTCETVTGKHVIEEPEVLKPDAKVTQHVTCTGGKTGIINASATGGNGKYEYNIYTIPASAEYPENKFVQKGEFTNLAAGTYYIMVRDVVGCISPDTNKAPIKLVVEEPEELNISLVKVTQQTCINDDTPTITVDVQGGTQPYYISVNNVELPNQYYLNQIKLGASEGIKADGVYLISVRGKDKGCSSVALPSVIKILEPIDLQLTVDFEYTCETGNFIKAMVADKFKDEVSYTLYDKNDVAVSTNTTGEFINVAGGYDYTITVTHTITGCSESSEDNPENEIPDILDIEELSMTIDGSEKNKIIVNADFGLEPYEYSIDNGDFGSEKEFTILQTKDYKISVKDARGCQTTLTVTGTYVSIKVLNLFTPDGDGINDYWYPLDVENYHNIKVSIYDRYARKIQDYQGFVQGWDGTYEGKPLPAGDYWYTIYYNELSGEEKKLMGHFTLYR